MTPTNESIGICPCDGSICVNITQLEGGNMNFTVYGREVGQGKGNWHIWNLYNNVPNGSYCFCMDTITPSRKTHGVYHAHTGQRVLTTNTWHNITFDHHNETRIRINVIDMQNVTLLEHGHYTINYWTSIIDISVDPKNHLMAIALFVNGVEVEGSYREMTFAQKQAQKHLAGSIHDEFNASDVLQLRYIGDSTNQFVSANGTWSADNISSYLYITKTGMEEHHPLQYNQTYQWHVVANVYNQDNLSITSPAYWFNTTVDPRDCACSGISGVGGGYGYILVGSAGIVGLIGVIGIIGYLKKRKEEE